MQTDPGESERLLGSIPPIRRARDWRLYAHSGERFLDLWMDGGRSILGAKGRFIGKAAKASIDMGLTRPLPSIWEERVRVQLAELWPEYGAARFFPSEARAQIRAVGLDPAIIRPFGEFLPETMRERDGATVALPILPCPSALAPGVLIFRTESDAKGIQGELVPPLHLVALSRSLMELSDFRAAYCETHWRKADRCTGGAFARRGPFLFPRYAREAHSNFFGRALAAGIVISPYYDQPSIIPGEFDEGELRKLPSP